MKRGLKAECAPPACAAISSVAEYSPMKRGLKGRNHRGLRGLGAVAEYSPMKRGLKGFDRGAALLMPLRVAEYSPMKRGLKGLPRSSAGPPRAAVAEYSPMKRGLKGVIAPSASLRATSCRVFPDEEGTESAACHLREAQRAALQSIPR